MIAIPPEVAIRGTIKPGSVYYFPEESFTSPDPHYFVVINIDPSTDEVILLVCASSKISKVEYRRVNCPARTLVKISPTQYPDFAEDSILDCNVVHEKTVAQLVEKMSKGRLKLKTKMDMKFVQRLRRGVLRSPLIPRRIKQQLLSVNKCG